MKVFLFLRRLRRIAGEYLTFLKGIVAATFWLSATILIVVLIFSKSPQRVLEKINITQVEVAGMKFSMDQKGRDKILDRLDDAHKIGFEFERHDVTLALERADRNKNSLVGAKILWVSDEAEDNIYERQLLESLGLNIQVVMSNSEAFNYLSNHLSPVDVIVTHAADKCQFKNDNSCVNNDYIGVYGKTHLDLCPVRYYQKISNVPLSVEELNRRIQDGSGIPTGYQLIESLAAKEYGEGSNDNSGLGYNGEYLTSRDSPKIIVYSASNGGVVMNPCTRTVTNKLSVMINNIVSILDEYR